MNIDRRAFLGASAAAAAGVSGCLGGDGGSLEDHEITGDLELAPEIGPEGSEKVIVAIEDPSCPSCARYSRNTFPQIRETAEAGELRYVVRPVGVVRDWGRQAAEAVVAVEDSGGDAFALYESFYSNQDRLDSGNVLDETRGFVDEAGLDGDDVVERVSDDEYSTVVAGNFRDARDAGMTATPTFFLFDGGGFVSQLSGSQGYGVFENALGL